MCCARRTGSPARDTRQTQKLLNHFEIRTPTVSYHRHNEGTRAQELLEEVAAGCADRRGQRRRDAGHRRSGWADRCGGHWRRDHRLPRAGGERGDQRLNCKRTARRSNLPSTDFFHRRRGSGRRSWKSLSGTALRIFFMRAPHRILDSLADLEAVFGAAEPVVVARELTKLHEEFVRGTIGAARSQLEARAAVRGEMVLMLAPARAANAQNRTAHDSG